MYIIDKMVEIFLVTHETKIQNSNLFVIKCKQLTGKEDELFAQ